MNAELASYIAQYGYLAIFSLVFLQEIGIPNPVPNEIVLLFSGYLTFTGMLSLPVVVLTAVFADFLGTTALYLVFQFFGQAILRKKPKWFPISSEKIERLTKLLSSRDYWGVFFGRLIPYVRGYTSVAAGLLQMKARIYLPMVFLSALLWSGGYVVLGNVLGPRWEKFMDRFDAFGNPFYILLGAILAYFVISHVVRHVKAKRDKRHVTGDMEKQ